MAPLPGGLGQQSLEDSRATSEAVYRMPSCRPPGPPILGGEGGRVVGGGHPPHPPPGARPSTPAGATPTPNKGGGSRVGRTSPVHRQRRSPHPPGTARPHHKP